jgi:ABC-type multidrug transport system, permease component
MFLHIFTNRIKCLFRDKVIVFWTLLFPIILSIFFNMAFSNLNNKESFHPIRIAVINNTQYQQSKDFKTILEKVSNGSDRTFNLTATTKESADKLLDDNEISGYITVGSDIGLTVKESGLNQSIIKAFLDQYGQTSSAVASIIKADPSAIQKGLLNDVSSQQNYTKEVSGTSAIPNNTLNYFYTLIAMACLYGAFWGLNEVNDIQADISVKAARINVAPVHKLKTFLYSMSASLTISFAELLLFLLFLRYALNVDFGSKTGFVVLTTFIGSLTGLSLGALISAIVKKNLGLKIAVLLAVSMTGSFLAGMMYQDMKYIIATNAPIVGYLNPVNLLTDAFYSLYYYDTYTRYALNMGLLGGFIVVFCTATYMIIRRQKYASL